MSKRARWIIAIGVLLLAVIALRWPAGPNGSATEDFVRKRAPSERVPALRGALAAGGIAGVVRAAGTTAPIAGARVCAACASCEPTSAPASSCALSDAGGRYELTQLPAAGYHVGALAVGFRPGSATRGQPIFVAPSERRDAIDIELSPGGAQLSGSVLDATGGSVAFARVRVVRLAPPRVSMDVEVDDAGRFAFWLDPGPVSLIAEADGYSSARATAVAPNRGVELRLVPGATIEGTVIAARSMQPLAGIEVRAAPASRSNSALFRAATSGELGEFRIDGLAPGSYALMAKGEHVLGRFPEAIDLEVADHVRGVVIEVATAASVRGRVVIEREDTPCRQGLVALGDPSSTEPRPARVAAPPVQGVTVGPEQVADIRPDGTVLFPGVPPGQYFATVRCPGHTLRAGPGLITVGSEPIAGLTWIVSAGTTLRVRVVDARGGPLGDAQFALRWPVVSESQARAVSVHRTDAAGSFEIEGLAPGTYDVLPGVGRDAGPGVSVAVRDGDRSAEVTLALAASSHIVVEVRDEDGVPVPSLRVSATEIVAEAARPRREHALELGEGRYRIGPVRAGEYRVTAADGVNPSAEVRVRAVDGRTAEERLSLPRGGVLRGVVFDESGEPLADAWVSARSEALGAAIRSGGAREIAAHAAFGSSQRRVLTDREGRFALDRLARSARYAVRAVKSRGVGGNAAVRSDVDPSEWIELRLQPAAAVSGAVVDATGRPVPEYRLQVTNAASETQDIRGIRDPSGSFALSDLPAGAVQLLAVAPSGEIGSLQLELSPGQKQSGLRLQLAAAEALVSAGP